MRHHKYLLTLALIISWVLTPLLSISQMRPINPEKNSYTLDVIESSPSNFEINNGTVLFSGSINTYSEAGKAFKKEHSQLAEESIALIDELSTSYSRTKQLNEQYLDQIANQVSVWKKFVNKNPSYKTYLNRELQIFNRGMNLQFQENTRWAVIESTLHEIELLNNKNPNDASLSFTKSALYTNLIIFYVDLNDFYKDKYKELITLSTLSHATQENPNLNLPAEILEQIKPLHAQELTDAKVLIYDQKNNIDKIKEIGTQTKELNDFYKRLNQYSISEIDNIISNLQKESKNLKPNATNFLAENNMTPLTEDYINYYKSLKTQLKEQILAQEIKEASLASVYEEELTKIAYTGMLYPGMEYAGLGDWASSAWSAVKTGTKVVSGAAFAAADYTTGKISETIFEVTDKASAMYDKGIFSEEYSQWSEAYDRAGENNSVVSIRDTFVNPLIATLRGDDQHGLGQAAVNKAQGSFKETDKYLADATGSNFISQVALNTVTCGGYGLAKDFTTINDANASTTDKIIAGAGIILAVVPIASGAKAANEGTKSTVKSAVRNVSQAADNIGTAIARSDAASSTLRTATTNLANATDDMIRAAGPGFNRADILDDAFNAVATTFDDAIVNKVTSQIAYTQAQQNVSSTIRQSIINIPKNTMTDSIRSTTRGFIADHTIDAITGRIKDLYTNSLGTAIKNAEPFFGQTIGDAIGIRDIANFTLTNFVNNNVTGGITATLGAIFNSGDTNNNQSQTPNQQTPGQQSPGQQTPGQQTPGQQTPGQQSPGQQTPASNTNQQSGNTVPQLPDNIIEPPMDPGSYGQQPPTYGPQQYTGNYPQQPPVYGPQQYTGNYPQQPPVYGPQPYTPNMNQPTDPNLLQDYLQGNRNNNTPQGFDPNEFTNVITIQQQSQQNLNDNRGQQNSTSSGYTPPPIFDTDTNLGGGTSISQHVQQLSTQTGQWHQQNQQNQNQQNQPGPQPTPTPTPSTPSSTTPSNIPIGDGVPEQNRTNGQDDDNDGVIDEGPATGSFQMAIHDTGGDKDDQWDLTVDGQSVGRNNQGKTRFWDLNLSRGQHTITATGVAVPDNVGTYTIWFGGSQVISGPPLSGQNLNQGTTFTWTIQVP